MFCYCIVSLLLMLFLNLLSKTVDYMAEIKMAFLFKIINWEKISGVHFIFLKIISPPKPIFK